MDIFLLVILYVLSPIFLAGSLNVCTQQKSTLNFTVSIFQLPEQLFFMQGVERGRTGSTGMNSVQVNSALCKEFMFWRVLILQAMVPSRTCLWHSRVENPNQTKRTDSVVVVRLIEIYFLHQRWQLISTIFFEHLFKIRLRDFPIIVNHECVTFSVTINIQGFEDSSIIQENLRLKL